MSTSSRLRRFSNVSLFAACYTYALIIFGGLVRITDSGMGCGDDWPKCNGKWIPDFTLPTFIEYMHRLLGVSIGLVLIAVFVYALRHRAERGFGGRGGVFRLAALVLALVVVQGLLGAVTVWLEIPPAVVVVHLATAFIIMAILLVAAVRARALHAVVAHTSTELTQVNVRRAMIAAGLGFTVVVLGALVANHPGAPQACQGFPLCNGALAPRGGGLVHMHWTHRVFAFGLFFYVLYAGHVTWHSSAALRVRYAAAAAVLMVVAQVGVAAALVLQHLPAWLQALHLAVGAAVWGSLVWWAALARIENGFSS